MLSIKLALALAFLSTNALAALVPGANFDRVFIVVLENADYSNASQDSYLSSLSSSGAVLTNYVAVAHPSEPNYIAMIAGSTSGVTDDGVYNLAGKNIIDLLEAKGISWKSYQENYPSSCFTGASSGLYYRKHNPFISFKNISGNTTRCAKIVDATQLDTDIENNTVPQYVFYTPNMDDDGHDTGLSAASQWLKAFLTPKLTNPAFITNTLVVITFDESESRGGKNQVYTALLGPVVAVTGADATAYSHYSLLATIEQNWGLGNLGLKDVGAVMFKNLAKSGGVASTTATSSKVSTTRTTRKPTPSSLGKCTFNGDQYCLQADGFSVQYKECKNGQYALEDCASGNTCYQTGSYSVSCQ